MSNQISKDLFKTYIDEEERALSTKNMLRTETDDVEKHVLEAQLRLVQQISDDFELGE
jgi:hypothetical protein